jgi:release factor glutamine methyltransferase
LIKKYLKSPHKDIAQLLSLVLEKKLAWLIANDDYLLSKDEICALNALIKKRESGVPFAYLSGTKGFYHLDFKVTVDTLIPRPETEILIDIALDLFKQKPCDLLDLGTGSGIIAITLADKNPRWNITATDFSKPALEVAKKNAAHKITFRYGNWFEAVSDKTYDLIISNPPYIETNDPHLSQLNFEPKNALISGEDGLDDIRIIINNAPKYLNENGFLLLEHGYNQQPSIQKLLSNNFHNIQLFKDYNTVDRAVLAQLK